MEPAYPAFVHRFEELCHAEPEQRMHQGWSNFCQWDENECPLVQARMRDDERSSVQDNIVVKENIQVDQAQGRIRYLLDGRADRGGKDPSRRVVPCSGMAAGLHIPKALSRKQEIHPIFEYQAEMRQSPPAN